MYLLGSNIGNRGSLINQCYEGVGLLSAAVGQGTNSCPKNDDMFMDAVMSVHDAYIYIYIIIYVYIYICVCILCTYVRL